MDSQVKALFIFKSENFLAPVGLCMISAIARKEGCETYLCEMNSEDALKRVSMLRPDIIAYSSSTGEAKHYINLNSKIKAINPEIFTIMGGPHPTFYPSMIHETTLDAICIGEGEQAFKDLLKARSANQPIENIPNIYAPKSNDWTVRDLEENLDALPFPDYGLLYDNTAMGQLPLKNFITSRGCTYSCTYCFNHAWNKIYKGHGKILRRNSVDYVIDNIKSVEEKWPLSCVKFYDDIFSYHADDWLEEFSCKYRQHIGLPFFMLTRADLLTEDMVKLLKHAGCRTISMSIEAGNPSIRNHMLKRGMSDEQIILAHNLCRKYGIRTFTNCITGLPGASLKDEIDSIDLCIKCHVDWAEFLIYHPYPGTELGDKLVGDGMYIPDYDKMHTSYMYNSPLKCFNDKDKNVHRNLSVLGAIAVVFPRLKNLIVNRLIHWRHNRLFTVYFFVIKMYIIRKKIYFTRTNLRESLRIYIRSFKQEIFRHDKQDYA